MCVMKREKNKIKPQSHRHNNVNIRSQYLGISLFHLIKQCLLSWSRFCRIQFQFGWLAGCLICWFSLFICCIYSFYPFCLCFCFSHSVAYASACAHTIFIHDYRVCMLFLHPNVLIQIPNSICCVTAGQFYWHFLLFSYHYFIIMSSKVQTF